MGGAYDARGAQLRAGGVDGEREDAQCDVDDDGVHVRRDERGLEAARHRVQDDAGGDQERRLPQGLRISILDFLGDWSTLHFAGAALHADSAVSMEADASMHLTLSAAAPHGHLGASLPWADAEHS